jgi:hypothetical protein
MDGLSAETLQCLLQTYEVALSELRATDDPGVAPLIDELARLQAEAVSTLAGLRVHLTVNGG